MNDSFLVLILFQDGRSRVSKKQKLELEDIVAYLLRIRSYLKRTLIFFDDTYSVLVRNNTLIETGP